MDRAHRENGTGAAGKANTSRKQTQRKAPKQIERPSRRRLELRNWRNVAKE